QASSSNATASSSPICCWARIPIAANVTSFDVDFADGPPDAAAPGKYPGEPHSHAASGGARGERDHEWPRTSASRTTDSIDQRLLAQKWRAERCERAADDPRRRRAVARYRDLDLTGKVAGVEAGVVRRIAAVHFDPADCVAGLHVEGERVTDHLRRGSGGQMRVADRRAVALAVERVCRWKRRAVAVSGVEVTRRRPLTAPP